MSEGLADVEWVASWIGLAKNLSYDLRKRHQLNRELQITSIMSKRPDDELEQEILCVTDAKSLYDNLTREQFTGAERRAALEVSVIRESLMALGGQARWIPHEENPSDCLTKLKGNASRLVEMLRTAKFKISVEEEELARRKAYRDATGKRNPRPNKSTVENKKPFSAERKGKGNSKSTPTSWNPFIS